MNDLEIGIAAKKPAKHGAELLSHLQDYFAYLDAKPFEREEIDCVDGVVRRERVAVPRTGSVTGFALFMGMTSDKFVSLKRQWPDEFANCIEQLRKRLLRCGVNKRFCQHVAALPLLDLRVGFTNYQ